MPIWGSYVIATATGISFSVATPVIPLPARKAVWPLILVRHKFNFNIIFFKTVTENAPAKKAARTVAPDASIPSVLVGRQRSTMFTSDSACLKHRTSSRTA